MATIKCIGCYELRREEMNMTSGLLVVYNCPFSFPYPTTIGGLLRPGSGILEAVKGCPQRIDEHCILCQNPPTNSYGEPPMVYTCKDHDAAWGKWLNEHPERRDHIAPKNRLIKANWIEVFREFVEDMRVKVEGES